MDSAYDHCQEITRSQARNFYFGIRLLPRDRRRALCAVYAFARRIDDVGDSSLPSEEKLELLESQRRLLRSNPHDDLVVCAVQDAMARLPIPIGAFDDLIDGVEMDVNERRYETFADLELYCRRVAGSIGRLSLGTFETADRPTAERLADDLGVALQLTNILRDVVEDRSMGRVYLPEEDLDRFGVTPDLAGPPEALRSLIVYEAERAEAWFDRGLDLIDLVDRSSASCVSTMAGIYRRLLQRIARHPDRVFSERVSLPGWEKGLVATRSLVRASA